MNRGVTSTRVIHACTFELLLLGVAALLAWFFNYSLFGDFEWDGIDAVIGILGIVPIALFFLWLLRSEPGWFARTRNFLEQTLRPFFAGWRVWQLGFLSIAAGVGEEFLFRGAIQGALTSFAGPWIALAVASVLFGLVHFLSVQYAIITAVMGAYLGLLFWWSDNLLAPIVTHAGYDFFALVYYLKCRADVR